MTDALVPLAHANVQQHTVKGVKGDWIVRENGTGRALGRFKARISDEDMFEILHFAREYELSALNVGIDWQKDKQNSYFVAQIEHLKSEMRSIIAHSDMLAETVERLTTGDN